MNVSSHSSSCDSLWVGADLVTMRDGQYNLIKDGFVAVRDGVIVAIGEREKAGAFLAEEINYLGGGILLPGFIDCHTHAVFGGNRSAEFEQRLTGKSYAEIAAQGGGILSTVRNTRNASEDELFRTAKKRLDLLMAEGVTTVEVKSGYGLDVETEIRMLRVIRQLDKHSSADVLATCLAAHAIPPEFSQSPDSWIDIVCSELLPRVKAEGLADAVDAFCEHLAFTPEQVERVFNAAFTLGLPVKLHAEQLSALAGSSLAAKYDALSADHLEYATENDARNMAQSGTVAVLLPGAFYLLHEKQLPPVENFRKWQVPMAIASDLNPGTSPVLSLRLILNMACTLFGLTPEEAIAGVTVHAAKALGISSTHGSLEIGKVANFSHWEVERPAELVYWLGGMQPSNVIYRGKRR